MIHPQAHQRLLLVRQLLHAPSPAVMTPAASSRVKVGWGA